MLFWNPYISSSFEMIPLTYHLHIKLHFLFYEVHLQRVQVSHRFRRKHLLPASPYPHTTLHLSFHPSRGGYIIIHCHTSANHQATQMRLSFTVTSVFFRLRFERGWWLFSLGNEMMPAAQRKDRRLRNNDTPCVILAALGTPHLLLDLML